MQIIGKQKPVAKCRTTVWGWMEGQGIAYLVWTQSMGLPTYCRVVTAMENVTSSTTVAFVCNRNTAESIFTWFTCSQRTRTTMTRTHTCTPNRHTHNENWLVSFAVDLAGELWLLVKYYYEYCKYNICICTFPLVIICVEIDYFCMGGFPCFVCLYEVFVFGCKNSRTQ